MRTCLLQIKFFRKLHRRRRLSDRVRRHDVDAERMLGRWAERLFEEGSLDLAPFVARQSLPAYGDLCECVLTGRAEVSLMRLHADR